MAKSMNPSGEDGGGESARPSTEECVGEWDSACKHVRQWLQSLEIRNETFGVDTLTFIDRSNIHIFFLFNFKRALIVILEMDFAHSILYC